MSDAVLLAFICFVGVGTTLALVGPVTHRSALVMSTAVITGMRATGCVEEGFHEIDLYLMVSRPAGGQFAAQATALIPEDALPGVRPGSVIDACYRPVDRTVVGVRVPPG
jgi:hypothetical protein